MFGLPVDGAHLLDLVVALLDIVLINANCVDPEPVRYIQPFCNPQELEQILSNFESSAVDANCVAGNITAPHVRQTYMINCQRDMYQFANDSLDMSPSESKKANGGVVQV